MLVIFGGVYLLVHRGQGDLKDSSAFATFGRLFSLITVAVLAVLLAFAEVGEEARTAAFAVLGAIAGYLAAATIGKTTATPTNETDAKIEMTQSGI